MTKKVIKKQNNMFPKNTQILEGSRAIALTIKNIEPVVISAYPITPQTHIVEDLAKFKATKPVSYEYVRAESEFAAASIVLGASATGVRTYSATSSQGILLMMEVLYNIAGLRLPIVMTCANRAVSSPINIWNDHSDAMAAKDSGWLQFFAENHQEAVYQHILAYKIAEKLNLPVMVNVDGFILTHSYEPVVIPDRNLIKKYLPNYQPKLGTYLNSLEPITMGGFFPPEAYFETRKKLYQDAIKALKEIKSEYINLKKVFNVKTGNGLVEYFGPKKPKTILVAMGSIAGTIKSVLKNQKNIGLIKIQTFRPFPEQDIFQLIKNCQNIIIIEKAISPGSGGHLAKEIKATVSGLRKNIKSYIVGLGGQDVSEKIITKIIEQKNKKSDDLNFIQ